MIYTVRSVYLQAYLTNWQEEQQLNLPLIRSLVVLINHNMHQMTHLNTVNTVVIHCSVCSEERLLTIDSLVVNTAI